jgi:hypothetical protein
VINYLVGVAVAAALHAHPDVFTHAHTVSVLLYLVLIVYGCFWIAVTVAGTSSD